MRKNLPKHVNQDQRRSHSEEPSRWLNVPEFIILRAFINKMVERSGFLRRMVWRLLACLILTLSACGRETREYPTVQMEPKRTVELAKSIEAMVQPELEEGLALRLWANDSLVADPIAIDMDDHGVIYYSRTNRQKNSEFDIRGHQDWEIESIGLQSVEDKRAFLRKTLSPENSEKNQWLADLNGDGSHDWRDLTVQKEHIYRVEDRSGDGVADFSQLIVEDFHEEITDVAGAVLRHNGELFVGVGPDLWRMRDNDGDGIPETKESISHGYAIHIGFGGHGMSGLEVGPEGKIYWGIGDIGFNGVDRDGRRWEHPNSGVIVRCNPDGSDFEVFAYGVRNTHEFVFDEYGNLISVDNDGDHPGEHERIVYIVDGSDSGWRINWQFGKYRDPDNNRYKVWMDEKMFKPRWEGQAAYITPPIANYVSGPAGMLYNPGTALSPKYENTFFIVEFVGNPARSGIHAFTLRPKGAAFELADTRQIVRGIAATGIDFGPDGAMYVADWIEGWGTKEYGRIWKLDVTGNAANSYREETEKHLRADITAYDEGQLSGLLKYPDMRLRQKAQFELVRRGETGLAVLVNNLKQTGIQFGRIHAIWGISQFARQDIKHAALLVPYLKDADPEIRAQAAKWLGDVRYREAGPELIPLLEDEYPRARFFAAEALGRIAWEPAIQPIIALLRREDDKDAYLRHAGSLALARIGKAEPILALASDESRALRIAAVVALRRMRHEGIASFLKDEDEFVVTEAARAINDDLSIEGALPALGDLLVTTSFANEPLIRRAINANLRVGTDKAMENLLSYVRKTSAPVEMRAEAIAALSTWARPSVVDRVDGRYRGEIVRNPEPVNTRSAPVLIQLTDDPKSLIRLHAARALGKMKIASGAEVLMTRLRNDPDATVRVEALKSLATIGYPKMDDAVKAALADRDKSVRVAGLDLLDKGGIDKKTMVQLLTSVIDHRTVEEKQAALLTLGKVPLEESRPVFEALLTRMENGKLPLEIQLELSEAINLAGSDELARRYVVMNTAGSPDSLRAAYRSALMGGDVSAGRNIFFQESAQCTRCHSFDDFGGNAGPRLNGVASRLTREQLLEALIDPSARIAPGFGTVVLELKNGTTVRGLVVSETEDAVVIKLTDDTDQVVQKTDVVRRTEGGSSMPPMHYLLTKRQIRDLISFLATLEE